MKTRLRKNKNGTFSVLIKDAEGKTRSIRTNATTRLEANQIAKNSHIREIQLAAESGVLQAQAIAILTASKNLTTKQAAEQYLAGLDGVRAPSTVALYRQILHQWIGNSKLTLPRITPNHVNSFINRDDGTSLSTRQVRLCAIRGFMQWAVEKGYRVGNPAGEKLVRVDMRSLSHAQKEPKHRQPMSRLQYEAILKACEGFWHHAVVLSYWTGMRLVDICALEWEQFQEDELIVWTRKTGKRVALPIWDTLIGGGVIDRELSDMSIDHAKYLFPKQRRLAIDPSKKQKLSREFQHILKKAGVKGRSFHSLRHSFVTRLRAEGVELKDIARLVGHSDTKTTEGYSHSSIQPPG